MKVRMSCGFCLKAYEFDTEREVVPGTCLCGGYLANAPWPRSDGTTVLPEKKPSNPKDRIGVTKVPLLSVMSSQVMGEVALGMLEGALKYGRHNYRAVGVRASVYGDAALRHVAAWWEGQDIDPASGLSHITKAISCLMVLRDSMMQENWVDDRPPHAKNQNWVDDLSAQTKLLLEKFPKPEAPWTQERLDEETA